MGITFGILSISALPPEILRNLGFSFRPSWNPRWRISTGHHIGGLATNRTFLSIIGLELGRFWVAPFWNSRWRPPGGVSELGPDLKMILVGYPTNMPSFIISSKSEIFCDYAAWLSIEPAFLAPMAPISPAPAPIAHASMASIAPVAPISPAPAPIAHASMASIAQLLCQR